MVPECPPTLTRSLHFRAFYGIYFDIFCQGQWSSRYPPPPRGFWLCSVKALTFFWLGKSCKKHTVECALKRGSVCHAQSRNLTIGVGGGVYNWNFGAPRLNLKLKRTKRHIHFDRSTWNQDCMIEEHGLTHTCHQRMELTCGTSMWNQYSFLTGKDQFSFVQPE